MAKQKKDDCPDFQNTGVRSVTKTYHPVTGKVTRETKNPCGRCK